MHLWKKVQQTWQEMSSRERRKMRSLAKGSPDAVLRVRCKVILALVEGNSPGTISRAKLSSESQAYRVIKRFRDGGLSGLVDRREDNGDSQVDWHYESECCAAVAGSPQDHGHRRPTWTQELLVIVLKKRTGIRISLTTMSRLLKRLGIRLGCPKPIVGCPWS